MEPSLGRSASTDRIAQSLATLTAKNTASREDMDDPALAELSGITSQTSQGLAADVYAEAAALDAAAAGAGGAAGAEAAAAGAGAGDEAGAAPPAAAEALPGSPMGRSPPAAGAPDAYAAVTPAPEPAAADAGAGVGAGASSGGSVRSSSSAGLLESPDKEIVRLELAQDRFPSDPRDPDVPRYALLLALLMLALLLLLVLLMIVLLLLLAVPVGAGRPCPRAGSSAGRCRWCPEAAATLSTRESRRWASRRAPPCPRRATGWPSSTRARPRPTSRRRTNTQAVSSSERAAVTRA